MIRKAAFRRVWQMWIFCEFTTHWNCQLIPWKTVKIMAEDLGQRTGDWSLALTVVQFIVTIIIFRFLGFSYFFYLLFQSSGFSTQLENYKNCNYNYKNNTNWNESWCLWCKFWKWLWSVSHTKILIIRLYIIE